MIHDFGNRNRHLGIHHLHRSDHYLDACIEKKHSRVHGHRFSYCRVVQWIFCFSGHFGHRFALSLEREFFSRNHAVLADVGHYDKDGNDCSSG